MSPEIKYLVGIDEAGRGPLAGSVSVGAVRIPVQFDWEPWRGVRDSKKLTPLARDEWFKKIHRAHRDGILRFAVAFASSNYIDRRGIVPAIHFALGRALDRLNADPLETLVLLDGSLWAPEPFCFQKTIIHGDDREPVISMASIAAKVLRDRKMIALARRYPAYGFESHKGYATREHFKRIATYGICSLHRKSFLTRLI
ncbi:MAG: hypothetical protein A2849_02855 [Candidatus Taylorbacteria bacterium RIFCSPHIGHO2_01_FULL_51_15]|uniref:Ribonuclease n=1 Tax=Candidatus Taylorbacteria bacterium RIFCSPHIGHO2_01_FULL_51_15 TaxID=1802304 RepID=A0A1G2MBH0_9BACT|nr:MAG: hypothetical protein A2849_02855 [Candidatus Taylorbacteria bacterium RIFCSPHIGHO2_01_FULL_51_15]